MKQGPRKQPSGKKLEFVDHYGHMVSANYYVNIGLSKLELAALRKIAEENPTSKGPRVGFAAWLLLRWALVCEDSIIEEVSKAEAYCKAEGVDLGEWMAKQIAERFDVSLTQMDGRGVVMRKKTKPLPSDIPDPDGEMDAEIRLVVAGMNARARFKYALNLARWSKQIKKSVARLERAECNSTEQMKPTAAPQGVGVVSLN